MADLYGLEDFETYSIGTGSFAGEGWTTEGAESVTAARSHSATKSVLLHSDAGAMQHDITPPELFVRFSGWFFRDTGLLDSLFGPSGRLLDDVSGADSLQVGWSIDVTGELTVSVSELDGGRATTLATVAGVAPDDEWFQLVVHIQMATSDGATDGAYRVLVNGAVVAQATGVFMTNSVDRFEVNGSNLYYDDTLVTDEAFSSPKIGSFAVGVDTTTTATRAGAIGLDGDTHINDEVGTLKIWANVEIFGDLEVGGTVTGSGAEDVRPVTHQLGGSRSVALTSSSYVEAIDWIDFVPAIGEFEGSTVTAQVDVRTSNAGTSVTPKIRNVTDSTDAVTGSACTATNADYSGTQQRQSLSFTPVAGKRYRLMIIGSNTINGIYGIGQIKVVWP